MIIENPELIALIGIVDGMTLMYAIGLLREFYRERRERRERKEFIKMLKSAIPTSATVMNYVN
jgi:hypothetical protein